MYFPTSKTYKSGPGILINALSEKRTVSIPPHPKDVKLEATPAKSATPIDNIESQASETASGSPRLKSTTSSAKEISP